MEKQKKYYILAVISVLVLAFSINFLYQNYYMGNYIVQKQWISSDYNNKTSCENCLWIEFYEGCNRYPVYYFENQHELDNRFTIGSVVNINFNGEYVKGVYSAKRYRYKC